jgi:Acetyltransferase (GNAT) domain
LIAHGCDEDNSLDVMHAKENGVIADVTSIFQQPWWLDAVAPGAWSAVEIRRGGALKARLPYVVKKHLGFTLVNMPPLTQVLGPWLPPYSGKYTHQLSEEKELMTQLIEQLPTFDLFLQNFHYSITSWLPFYWKGFQQTTRYTYVIEDLTDLDKVLSGFARFKHKNIKKAKNIVEVREDLSAKDFYDNHVSTLSKQAKERGVSKNISYSFELFSSIYNACYKNNAGKIFYSIDKDNNLHSAIFTIWDKSSAYNLISTIDPDFRSSGSASLLIWEALKYYSGKTKRFDFEGSMIEGVERSFRAFGAKQKPYFQVSKVNSLLLRVGLDLRSWLRHVCTR